MIRSASTPVNLPALTGIRGVAAWFVVLFHIRITAGAALPPGLVRLFGKGYLAVDLFFMLSGFVLWLNYAERLRARGLGAAPLFLARRLARIWPLHIFILGWAVLFALALVLTGNPNPDSYPWSELPLHVLLIQNWGFTDTLTWNDPAWSISCEFAAYLLFPLLALAVDWRRFGSAALVGLLALLALTLHAVMAAHGATTLGADVPHLGLPRALAEFAMGTILCALWERWRATPRLPLALSLVAIIISALLLGRGAAETLFVPSLLAALLFAVALTDKGSPLGWRPIHYLGEISYATYLVHYLLFIAFKLLFVSEPQAMPLSLAGLFLALTFAASVALHHLIERPAQRALNRAFASSPLVPAAGPT